MFLGHFLCFKNEFKKWTSVYLFIWRLFAMEQIKCPKWNTKTGEKKKNILRENDKYLALSRIKCQRLTVFHWSNEIVCPTNKFNWIKWIKCAWMPVHLRTNQSHGLLLACACANNALSSYNGKLTLELVDRCERG